MCRRRDPEGTGVSSLRADVSRREAASLGGTHISRGSSTWPFPRWMGAEGQEPRQSRAGATPESGGEAGAEPTGGGVCPPSSGLGSTRRQHRLRRAKSRRDLSGDAGSDGLGLYGAGPGGAEPPGDGAGVGSKWRRAGRRAGFRAPGRGRGGARLQTEPASSQCYDARSGGGAQEGHTGARGRGLATPGDSGPSGAPRLSSTAVRPPHR